MSDNHADDDPLSINQLRAISNETLRFYDENAGAFSDGTSTHDVTQNINALLTAIPGTPPYRILDVGCGPGRDLVQFLKLGHEVVGLDGSPALVAMARKAAGCEVYLQDFLALDLPPSSFDGVFANASLFHVPEQAIADVLNHLCSTLKPDGVLFTSNPRGNNQAGWSGGRYGCFYDLDHWRRFVSAAGFVELDHYYRPPGKPRHLQPWLATVWRKRSG